jgi:hypothetical protein
MDIHLLVFNRRRSRRHPRSQGDCIMKAYSERWELKPIPLTPVDLVNRRAAAEGSMRFAMLASDADYNGHAVTITHKPHAMSGPIWNSEYFWAGRRVLGRGSFARCVEAAVREYQRGAHGTTVVAFVSDEDENTTAEEQRQILRDAGFYPTPDFDPYAKPDYWTGTHDAVCDTMHWVKWGHADMIPFALAFEGTKEEWDVARKKFLADKRAA